MNHAKAKGFSLLELLAVISILGFIPIAIQLGTPAINFSSVDRDIDRLTSFISAIKQQAIYTEQPIAITLSDHTISSVFWSPGDGGWVQRRANFDINTDFKPKFVADTIDPALLHRLRTFTAQALPKSTHLEVVFWPDGSSSGSTIILEDKDDPEVTGSISISRSGAVSSL